MRLWPLSVVFVGLIAQGCGGKSKLSSDEQEYVLLTLDLMKTKAHLAPETDTNKVKESLKPVYARHKTTAEKYLSETRALSNDPESATRIVGAIRDSTGTQ